MKKKTTVMLATYVQPAIEKRLLEIIDTQAKGLRIAELLRRLILFSIKYADKDAIRQVFQNEALFNELQSVIIESSGEKKAIKEARGGTTPCYFPLHKGLYERFEAIRLKTYPFYTRTELMVRLIRKFVEIEESKPGYHAQTSNFKPGS